MRWFGLFENQIVERGFDYYKNDLVHELYKIPGGYHAFVEGTKTYDITIYLDDTEVGGMSCTCPYFCQHDVCKHLAAVLFAIEEKEGRLETVDNARGLIDISPLSDLIECMAPEPLDDEEWDKIIEILINSSPQLLLHIIETISESQPAIARALIALYEKPKGPDIS